MGSRVNYTIVGLFVVIFGLGMVVAGFWITEGRHAQTYKTYVIVMKESVAGLSEHAPVKFNGVEVGFVKEIKLDPNNPQQVLVYINIEEGAPITESSISSMRPQGITGLSYVAIKATSPDAPPLVAKKGEEFPHIPSSPSLLLHMDTVLRQVTSHIQEISTSLRSILDEENRSNVKSTLENTKRFTETLAKNSEEIDASIKTLNRVLHNASIASEQFPIVVKKANRSLDSIYKMANQVTDTGREMTLTMREGRVAIKTFNQQGRI